MKVFIAADHQGQEALETVRDALNAYNVTKALDVTNTWISYEGDDYPDVAESVVKAMALKSAEEARGILICGSAQGIAMAANRYPHIRAAPCGTSEDVRMTRAHQDLNVLCISAWNTQNYLIESMVHAFLSLPFEGGRHLRRLYKMTYTRGTH